MGAGRKPKVRPAVVLGMNGVRREDSPPVGVQPQSPVPSSATSVLDDLTTPPHDLTEAQQAFWRTYAGHAIDLGTLVPATVAGFRELCEQFALKQAIAQRIEKLKATSKRAETHLRTYVRLSQRVDSTLARFKLTSFGKPADGAIGGLIKQAPVNPFAAVAKR